MNPMNRRQFLGRLGSSMVVSAGALAVADELELLGLVHAATSDRLDFGDLEPLVATMQDTPADALMPRLKAELDSGTPLDTLVAAAALANARTFGGQDYVGYHCFMAIVPALAMAARLDGRRAALPVLKVLHRNTATIQASGGRRAEVLRKVDAEKPADGDAATRMLVAGRSGSFDKGEALLAQAMQGGPDAAYRSLQPLVRDNIDVHQVVLAFRSWDMLQLAGEDNAHVLLRQVLRHCIDRDAARRRAGRAAPAIRDVLPVLVERHHLDRPRAEQRRLTTDEADRLAGAIFSGSRDDAAGLVAERLGAGVAREDVAEALSLASVRLLLHDPGRSRGSAGKPAGSVHGASVGLHAADSANAWRGIAAATPPTNAAACLVTGAWHTAGQAGGMDTAQPYHATARKAAAAVPRERLPDAIAEAVRGGDQRAACALAERYGQVGGDPDALIALLIEPAIRHDGALHHEKYFHTATEEFARTRVEHRWEHLVALTRVMASGYGFESDGFEVSRRVLGV